MGAIQLYAFKDKDGAVSLISLAYGIADHPREHKGRLAEILDDALDSLSGVFGLDLR